MAFQVYINGIAQGAIVAPDYRSARIAAKKLHRVSCDVIGSR